MRDHDVLKSMSEAVKSFCEERDWDRYHNPKDLAIGISTEANELLDLFRFKGEADIAQMMKNPAKRRAISEELADVLFFLLRFAERNGFDLESALQDKLQLNAEKYPADKVRGKNLKYDEYDEYDGYEG